MSDLNLYSVNWQDGMLVSKQHLKDQEKYFEDLVRWHALSAGDNFGLVKKSEAGRPALIMNLSVAGNRLRVEVISCHALTPDGHYIEISESTGNVVIGEAVPAEAKVPVYISVNTESKRQIGEPDPKEDMPRIPYLAGSYALHLGGQPSLPEGEFLQIAELSVAGNEATFSEGYYPPCLTISADERLNRKALDLRNRLENLLSLSSRAYTAIASAGALSSESSSLQVAFKETMFHMAYHLSATLDEFVTGRNGTHPIHLVILFKRLFRVFSTLLNLQPGLKDYLNEKLFAREMNSEVGRFMAAIDAFLLSGYDHRDIGGQVKMIDDTVGALRAIFGFLAQLKREQLGPQAITTDTLTYLGKSYHIVNYVSLDVEQVGELSYVLLDLPSPQPVSDTVVLMSKGLFSAGAWNNMQVRLGLNEARGLGETDPVDVDAVTYGDKVALHPQDMLRSPSVSQVTLTFRGTREMENFQSLKKPDLILYTV